MTRTINRRTILKGAGCAVALPLLEAMFPRYGFASEAPKAPVRMAFVAFPNGAIMDAWRPIGTGKDFEYGRTLEALNALKHKTTIITGLAQDNGRAKGDGAGDHARSSASLLTGAHPVKTSGANIRVGQSVDQAAAERIGHLTRLPSLEIGLERGRDAGSCDSGYSCAYSNNISWRNATTPMPKEVNPKAVFERLFGNSLADSGQQTRRARTRKSVLDLVAEQAGDLKKQLGSSDLHKVDQYFTSVREIEQRIARAGQHEPVEKPDLDVPEGVPQDLVEHTRLMYDLMALAFQTDSTRIITYMVGNEGSNRSYKMVGVNEGHHELSHHQNDEHKMELIRKIDGFLASEYARFVKHLDSIPEGEGTLLDHSMIMYASGLSDGNRHYHHDLPVVIAGSAGGTMKNGLHLDLGRETPLNNLFLSMLDRVGANISALGDSTGRLTTIDA